MKGKKIALLLAIVLEANSVFGAASAVSAADFSAEVTTTEESEMQDLQAEVSTQDDTDEISSEAEQETEVFTDEENDETSVDTDDGESDNELFSDEEEVTEEVALSIIPDDVQSLELDKDYTVNVEEAWFSFTPEEDGIYSFSSTNDGRYVDPQVYFYDYNYISDNRYYTDSDDDGKNNRDFLLAEELKAGITYYYRVVGYDPDDDEIFSVKFIKVPKIHSITASNLNTTIVTRFDAISDIVYYAKVTVDYGNEYTPYERQKDDYSIFKDAYGTKIYPAWLLENGETEECDLEDTLKTGTYNLVYTDGTVISEPHAIHVVSVPEYDRYKGNIVCGAGEGLAFQFGDYISFEPEKTGNYVFYYAEDSAAYVDVKTEKDNDYETIDGVESMYSLEGGKTYYIKIMTDFADNFIVKNIPVVTSVTLDTSETRTSFVADLETFHLTGLKIIVNYEDNREPEVLTFNDGDDDDNSIKDSYGNFFEYYLEIDDDRYYQGNYLEKMGTYPLKITYNGSEIETQNTVYITLTDSADNLFPELKLGSNLIESPQEYDKWYYFKPSETEKYKISPAYYISVRTKTEDGFTELDRITGDECVVELNENTEYYIGFRGGLWSDEDEKYIHSWNVTVKKYIEPESIIPDDAQDLTLGTDYTVTIDENNTQKWFSFTPEEDGTYVFTASKDWMIRPEIRFYDKKIVSDINDYRASDIGGNEGGGSLLKSELRSGKKYYYCVMEEEPNEPETFSVKLEKCVIPYFVNKELELDEDYRVSIDEDNPEKWFSFEPDEDGAYKFSVDGNVPLYMYCYDKDSVTDKNAYIEYDITNGEGKASLNVELEERNTYYFCIEQQLPEESGTATVRIQNLTETAVVSSISVSNVKTTMVAGFDTEPGVYEDAKITIFYADDHKPYNRKIYYMAKFTDIYGNKIYPKWKSDNGELEDFSYTDTKQEGTYQYIYTDGNVSSETYTVEAVSPDKSEGYKGEVRVGVEDFELPEGDIVSFKPTETGVYKFANGYVYEKKVSVVELKDGIYSTVPVTGNCCNMEAGVTYYIKSAQDFGIILMIKKIEKEASFISVDDSNVKKIFLAELENCFMTGLKYTVNYEGGEKSETFTITKKESMFIDKYDNIFEWYFEYIKYNDRDNLMDGDCLPEGVYKLIITCNGIPVKIENPTTFIVNNDVQGQLKELKIGSNHIYSPWDGGRQFYYFIPSETGTYSISPFAYLSVYYRAEGETKWTRLPGDWNGEKFNYSMNKGTLYCLGFSGCRYVKNPSTDEESRIEEWDVTIKNSEVSECEWKEILNEKATCTKDGKIIKTCIRHGETEETIIPALGHTEEVDEGKASTCTESGLTEGRHCSVCGEVLEAQEEIPPTGHTEEIDEGKAPTCTESGLTEGKHCSVCGEVLETQKEIPATGHSEEVQEGKAPTCTENGLTEGKHCSVCGEVLEAQEEIPATGHVVEVDEAKAATCTEPGLTEGKHCSVCGEVLEAQEEIPATGHSEEVDEGKKATCTESGLTEGKHCSVCGEVLEAQKEIPATGHTVEVDEGKVPTCTESGLTEGKHCSVCGEVLEAQKEILATGHTDGEWTITKEATAVSEGQQELRCTVCGNVIQTKNIAKLKATIKLNIPKTLPLKVKQTFQIKVSGLAKGDKVSSWKSSNTKIATVTSSGKITGKKSGTATITVKLRSGLTSQVKVKVQKTDVAATSITVLNKATNKKITGTTTLKAKKKLALAVTLSPVTCRQKVTYTSSNKKVAAVSSKGVITALKKGTATITVKVGKKTSKIKIKVK